jgi:hypothetical protein
MAAQVTAQPSRSGRRVVRRARPTLNQAHDEALSGLPPEVRPAVIAYADAKRAEFEARSALSGEMIRHGLHWYEVDCLAQKLAFAV